MATRSAGTLDRRITIERHTQTGTNGFNEPVFTWQPLATVWAARRDASDAEAFAAGQVGASLRTRFVIRRTATTATVTPKDRLSCDGAVWNIKGVKEGDGGAMRGRYIEITAVRDND
ncbi:MAG: phage head closure protein [Dysgonamonadaceae bacterium]